MTKENKDRYFELWCHQNELLWNRLKTLATLQAGIFAGWYVLYKDEQTMLALLLAVIGFLLSVILYFIIYRDAEVQRHYKELLETESSESKFAWHPKAKFWSGKGLILFAAGVFIVANGILMFISVAKLHALICFCHQCP